MKKSFVLLVLLLLSSNAAFGQTPTNKVAAPMADVNGVIDNTLDSLNIARTARPVSGSTRVGDNPVLFLVGNSTMRTGALGNGQNGQWGWGYYMAEYFDPAKVTVENHALGGMSSRTFYTRLWPEVKAGIRPGDWVIIELGHNDNGPYDSGRARASIPGIGTDSLQVVIQETGKHETVYTYGEYMRRYIRDVKACGATPILMSLTPRCAWDDKDSTIITRVDKTFGKWAREVAEAEGVPFVDLNDITARKYERYGKDKVKTMFYLDRIHTSEFGARVNAESAVEGLRGLSDIPLKDWMIPEAADSVTGASRRPARPVVFVIGDSTVKNEDSDDGSMWGWGSVLAEKFDTSRVSIENHAMAGRSARTFLDEGRWDRVYRALQPGDYVLMQFGHNDGGDINVGKARGELHGAGPESQVFRMEATGKNKVIYTYGWYLRKFVMDAREKGAIPVIVSHTPRNKWHDGHIESNHDSFGLWARQAALQSGAYFIDLNAITGHKLQALGESGAARYFKNDHTHSSLHGARLNAVGVAEGLLASDCSLKDYILPQTYHFDMKDVGAYNDFDGYGYDFGTQPAKDGTQPYYFSVRVPDGNYVVDVVLGDKKREAVTTVRAESRRVLLNQAKTRKGERANKRLVVNKRSPAISLRDTVALNPLEWRVNTWDGKLTFEFTGERPAVAALDIRPVAAADSVVTVFLCGNSTVVDQTDEPWTSWGQIVPAWFDSRVAICNNAESGERTTSFINKKRYDKVLSMSRPGDWVIVEFGHNDEKDKGAGTGAWYNFSTNLKTMIDRAREAGLNVVLVTPTARRCFDDDGRIVNTHGDYADAVRAVAEREGVPLIDLTAMTTTLYESLGVEGSKKAFVHYPAGTFPGQENALADNTHFNQYGATQVAKCLIEGLRVAAPELGAHITLPSGYDPANPDDADAFVWPLSQRACAEKPAGN